MKAPAFICSVEIKKRLEGSRKKPKSLNAKKTSAGGKKKSTAPLKGGALGAHQRRLEGINGGREGKRGNTG